ncbi:hypothetical protein MRB53_002338 [Persea americana]|uniref:Uncharacterized protein n=1 Tax=Persea americana TaxID=3435 RepID=A0ACC2MU89_PERAE|nr:hypothetical protein MRB53_002338 [Persea americana]
MEGVFEVMGCSDRQKAILAAFKLEGDAKSGGKPLRKPSKVRKMKSPWHSLRKKVLVATDAMKRNKFIKWSRPDIKKDVKLGEPANFAAVLKRSFILEETISEMNGTLSARATGTKRDYQGNPAPSKKQKLDKKIKC